MQALLKFTLLASALCLNLFSFEFSDPGQYSPFINLNYFSGMRQIDAELISDEYFSYRNDIYKIITASDYFVLAPAKFNHFTIYGSDFYYFNPSPKTAYCEGANTDQTRYSRNCSVEKIDARQKIEYQNVKRISATKVATCEPGENFNTSTQKCQSCPSGQSWNPKTNSCFTDCTDEKTNKWGWSDGSCTDCSASKTTQDVYRCFCGSLGLGVPPTITDVGVIGKPGYFKGQCADGNIFEYRDPEYKPDPKPDDNKTKPDDPKPNPDDPKPDPGGDSGGGNSGGGSGGGNSGDSQDNPNPNPSGGSGDNPDPKPNPNPGGGSGGGSNGGKHDGKNKDVEAKFNKGDFDDGDLEKERNSLYNGIVKHINDNISKFDGIREGVDQFLKNVQGKGFETVKTSIKSKCPMKKEIPLPNGGSKDITVDLCEYVSPASEISYYAFYVGFAVGGFLLFLKLLIFSF